MKNNCYSSTLYLYISLPLFLHDYNVKFLEIELPAYNWRHVLWRKWRTCPCSLFFSLAHVALIYTLHLVAASISYFLTAATKFLCCSFNKIIVSFVFYLSLSPPPRPLSLSLSLSFSLVEFHCGFSLPSHDIFPGIFSGNRLFSLPFLDLDECVQGSHDCLQSLASCSNTDGSFKCSCNDGYIGDGKTYCQPKSKDVFIISMSGFISLQAR